MISSIVWVPAGVADPCPKRYEMSAQEMEILRLLEEQEQQEADGPQKIRGGLKVKVASSPLEHNLPADLRMDEYSDDEDDDAGVGRLLVGQTGMVAEEQVEEGEDDDDDDENHGEMGGLNDDVDSDDDEDDDKDDDLEDVPDTREFEPVDLEGLQAMGLNQIGNAATHMEGLGDDDDDSEAENVRLSDTDAIILVAKTEDVSLEVVIVVFRNSKSSHLAKSCRVLTGFCSYRSSCL